MMLSCSIIIKVNFIAGIFLSITEYRYSDELIMWYYDIRAY